MRVKSFYVLAVPAIFMIMWNSSCVTTKKTVWTPEKELPAQFPGDHDTTENLALQTRDKFFTDPYLQQLIAKVLTHNPDMLMAMKRVEMAASYLKMSRNALWPSLSAQVTAGATKYGKYTIDGVGNFDTNLSPNIDENQKTPVDPTPDVWMGLRTSWEIDLWGKLSNMKEAAKHRFLATEQGKNLIKASLVTQTALLYYELIALEKEKEIIHKHVQLQEQALEIVEAQSMGGRATQLAVQQFKASLLNTKAIALQIQKRIKTTENQLNALAGQYSGEIAYSNKSLLPDSVQSILEVGVPAQLLLHRPDLQQAHAELIASRADAKAAKAAFFPSVNISAYTAFHAFKPELWLNPASLSYSFLSGLTAPIFQHKQIREQFKIATAAQEVAVLQYQKTALQAYKEVITLLQEINTDRTIRTLKQQEVSALEEGIQAANDLYLAGYASYLEIVTAQKSKLEAELQLLDTERQMVTSMLLLYQSLGGGWQK